MLHHLINAFVSLTNKDNSMIQNNIDSARQQRFDELIEDECVISESLPLYIKVVESWGVKKSSFSREFLPHFSEDFFLGIFTWFKGITEQQAHILGENCHAGRNETADYRVTALHPPTGKPRAPWSGVGRDSKDLVRCVTKEEKLLK